MVKLTVSNIDASVSKQELKRLFEEFGHIKSLKLFRKESGGLGLIEMATQSAATEAVSALNGKKFKGSILGVAYSGGKIQPKNESKARLKVIDLDDDDPDLSIISSKNNYKGSEKDLEDVDLSKWKILKKKNEDGKTSIGKEEYEYDDADDNDDD